MKMTRLEWRYLKRIALDHPYFDTHKLPLTEKEAKAIVEANNRMTGREFVDSVYAKLGMTRPQEEKKRFAKLRSVGELFTVPPIRRIAVAVLVVLLMTVFFAATPTGRAIAERFFRYTVKLFDNGLLLSNNSGTEELMFSTESDLDIDSVMNNGLVQNKANFAKDSIEGFIERTGKRPCMFSDYELTGVVSECDKETAIILYYRTTGSGTVRLLQIWDATYDMAVFTNGSFKNYLGNERLYYSLDDLEQGCTFVLLLEDTIVIAEVDCLSDMEVIGALLSNFRY